MFGGNLEKLKHFYFFFFLHFYCFALFIGLFTKTCQTTSSYRCKVYVYWLLRVGINLFQVFSKLVFMYNTKKKLNLALASVSQWL